MNGMNRLVQGIIIKNSHVLSDLTNKDNNGRQRLFFNGNMKDGEKAYDAVERIAREQYGISARVIFKLNRELYDNVFTFVLEITEDNIEVNADSSSLGYIWIPLGEHADFLSNDIIQLKYLLETCLDKNHSPDWLENLQRLVLSNKQVQGNSYIINKIQRKEHRIWDKNTPSVVKNVSICISLILGTMFYIFFDSKSLGISYPLFLTAIAASFFYFSKNSCKGSKSFGMFILLITFVLGVSFSIHSNPVLAALNFMAVPFLLAAAFIIMRYENIKWYSLKFIWDIFIIIFPLAFENFLKPLGFIRERIHKKEKTKLSPTQKNIFAGVLISLPLLIIILPLLISADSVFGYYITCVFKNLPNLRIDSFIRSILIILLVSLYLFGFFWSFRYPKIEGDKANKTHKPWEALTILTVMIIINLVYLIFTVIQFSYLYGDGNAILPNGFTYAEYARRGFFELVMVTIINFTILLLCMRFMDKGNMKMRGTLNITFTLLVLFTVNMLISANYKMSLYESAFGYTYLRVFVQLFMLLLLLLFTAALITIWVPKFPLAKVTIVLTLVMYVFVNYINVDTIIASKNIDRYFKTGNIDVGYFYNLSFDVVPLVHEFATMDGVDSNTKTELSNFLKYIYKRLDKNSTWFEFNYSKYKAYKSYQ